MYHYVRPIKQSQYPEIKGLELEGFLTALFINVFASCAASCCDVFRILFLAFGGPVGGASASGSGTSGETAIYNIFYQLIAILRKSILVLIDFVLKCIRRC